MAAGYGCTSACEPNRVFRLTTSCIFWLVQAFVSDGATARTVTERLLAPTSGKAARTGAGDAAAVRQQQQRAVELFTTVTEVLRHFWAALQARDQVSRRRRCSQPRPGAVSD